MALHQLCAGVVGRPQGSGRCGSYVQFSGGSRASGDPDCNASAAVSTAHDAVPTPQRARVLPPPAPRCGGCGGGVPSGYVTATGTHCRPGARVPSTSSMRPRVVAYSSAACAVHGPRTAQPPGPHEPRGEEPLPQTPGDSLRIPFRCCGLAQGESATRASALCHAAHPSQASS